MKTRFTLWFTFGWLLTSMASAHTLIIENGGKTQSFETRALLKRSEAVELSRDPTYGRSLKFRGIAMRDLLKDNLPSRTSTVLFEALDGFRVSVPAEKLFYTDGLRPVLTIEDPKAPWPHLKKKQASAGPFYLIWANDNWREKVGQEEWPFMVTKIIVQRSIAEEYPALIPQGVKEDSKVFNGYQSFVKNCFACHTMAGEGGEKMGPDLNIPHSPTEYLKREYFEKLVRNPQSLRQWGLSQMSSFDESDISKEELDHLWRYLSHMASQRR